MNIISCCLIFVVAFALVSLCDLNNNHRFVVTGKEIIATNEWTKLGENDTIGAGLHVRIDISTGEKWVKLLDDDDPDRNQAVDSSSTTGSGSNHIMTDTLSSSADEDTATATLQKVMKNEQRQNVDTMTNQVVIVAADDGNIDDDKSNNNNEKSQEQSLKQTSYDFDMMYRTLEQLPEEDKKEMGLPEILPPPISTASTTIDEQQRVEFEKKMIKIWEYRQEQLRQIQNELVADLPKILKERIRSIQNYVRSPIEYINQLILLDNNNNKNNIKEETGAVTNNSDLKGVDDDDENDSGVQSNNIISILNDLEYHLTDVDMARDFHTMHGWSLLASLLSDHIHHRDRIALSNHYWIRNKHNNDQHNSNETVVDMEGSTADHYETHNVNIRNDHHDDDWVSLIGSKIDLIQTHVAWVLGTAVKNTGEFTPYVLEEFTIVKTYPNHSTDDNDNMTSIIVTTPLDLLFQQIQNTVIEMNEYNNSDKQIINYYIDQPPYHRKAKQQKLDKLLYCLGSFLRGNRRAQIHFGAKGGSALLQNMLSNSIEALSNINHRSTMITDDLIEQQLDADKKLMMKRIQRIVQLSIDIIMEVTSIQQKYDHIDPTTQSMLTSMSPEVSKAIVQSLTSSEWCHTILQAFDPSLVVTTELSSSSSSVSSLHQAISHSEILLQGVNHISPYCITVWREQQSSLSTDDISINDSIISSTTQWIAFWDGIIQKQQNENRMILDLDHYQELLQLSKNVIDQFIDIPDIQTSSQ